jgi:hypothetical protein
VRALAAAGPWSVFARNPDDQPALRVTAYAITGAIAASDNAADGKQLSQHKHSHSSPLAAAIALKVGFYEVDESGRAHSRFNAEGTARVASSLPGQPDVHVVPAGHYAFLPPCTPQLALNMPRVCTDPAGFDRGPSTVTSTRALLGSFANILLVMAWLADRTEVVI